MWEVSSCRKESKFIAKIEGWRQVRKIQSREDEKRV